METTVVSFEPCHPYTGLFHEICGLLPLTLDKEGWQGFILWLVNLQEIKIKLCMFMTYHLKRLKRFYGSCFPMFLVSTYPSIKRGRNLGKSVTSHRGKCFCILQVFHPLFLCHHHHMQWVLLHVNSTPSMSVSLLSGRGGSNINYLGQGESNIKYMAGVGQTKRSL